MKYQSFLVRRYLSTRFIPYAAVIAVAFGVFALISVLSVMEGFKFEMRDRIRGSLSHLIVSSRYAAHLHDEDKVLETIRGVEHVEAVAPFVNGLGLYRSRVIDTFIIRGVDPLAEASVGDFRSYLIRPDELDAAIRSIEAEGDYTLPIDRTPLTDEEILHLFSRDWREEVMRRHGGNGHEFDELPPQPIVVGIEALRHRTVDIGQIVTVTSYSPLDFGIEDGDFLVVGAFRTGVHEQDLNQVYMPIRACQEFLGLFDEAINDYRFSGVSVRLDDFANAEEARTTIDEISIEKLPSQDTRTRTWEENRKTLLSAVDIEKRIIFAMMLLIVMFAGAMIFLILALMAIEKTRDLGVLQSLGATPNGVVGIFMRLGLTLSVVGIIIGGLAGWLFTTYINVIHDWISRTFGVQLFPPDIYYLTEIPVRLIPQDMALILGPALLFGYLGSLLPALHASRKDPVKSLRHE